MGDRFTERLEAEGWSARVTGMQPRHAEPETVAWLAKAIERIIETIDDFPRGWVGDQIILSIEHVGTGERLAAAFNGEELAILVPPQDAVTGD